MTVNCIRADMHMSSAIPPGANEPPLVIPEAQLGWEEAQRSSRSLPPKETIPALVLLLQAKSDQVPSEC